MQKKLLKQIRNEWRTNLWLAVELLVVSVVMWFCIDFLYAIVATQREPLGFDISHCYLVKMGELTDKSPDYKPYESAEQARDEILQLADRIRHRPEVEAVSLSQNSYPYNGSNSTISLQYDTLRSPRWTIRRKVTPDFVKVFRYRGANGETPEQLAAVLERGELLASANLFNRYGRKTITDLVGKDFILGGDTSRLWKVGASLQPVRYSDHEQARFCYTVVINLNLYSAANIHSDLELCVRVKEGMDHDFINRLKADSESQYRIGNLYIADVRSFADIRRNFERGVSSKITSYATGMGFLLLNIFLGLLGTFWFRTQQRRKEVALQMAMGSSRRGVFSRLLGEGLLLLLVITPFALLADYIIAANELNAWYNGTTLEWGRLLFCAVASFLLIALMILIGIWYPARQAMRIQPAEALHDD